MIATGFDCTTAFCLSHLGEKGYSVYLEIFGGGYGASKAADGCDAVDSPLSNCSNAPVESLDIDYDFFRITGYELAPDSFGLGARRGGAGFGRVSERPDSLIERDLADGLLTRDPRAARKLAAE